MQQREAAQLHGVDGVEKVAVEVADPVCPEETSFRHLSEQVSHRLVEGFRIVVVLADNPGEEAVGQQPGILRVEAEHDLIQVAGQLFQVDIVPLHFLHDGMEQVGRFLGGLVQCTAGAEFDRGVKCPPQLVELLLLVQGGHGNDVLLRGHTGGSWSGCGWS